MSTDSRRETLLRLVQEGVREVAPQDVQLPADLGPETSLFGKNGILDSIALVGLVVTVEEQIDEEFGASVALADDRAMSQTRSPYRTIGSLIDYALELIGNGS